MNELKIGKTPTYIIRYIYKGILKEVIVKDESYNLSGSIKMRPAYKMFTEAYKEGIINENSKLCEVTSGNMGIALATLCQKTKNSLTILMSDASSLERRKILKDLGANLIITKNYNEAFKLQEELEKEGYICLKQFENINNALSYIPLCEELEEVCDKFNAFIAGVGTGGTLNGIGHYLNEKYNTNIYALEPVESSVLTQGFPKGAHKIEGLADERIPKLYPKDIVKKIISVKSNDAICMAQKLKEELGLNVGISSGANFLGAVLTEENSIITVFADDDTKYYSTDLMNKNLYSPLVDEITLLSYTKK